MPLCQLATCTHAHTHTPTPKNVAIVYSWAHYKRWEAYCSNSKRMCRSTKYRAADKSLARTTSRCILFDGQNISFDASLAIYTNSTNIPPIKIINKIYENL